MRQEKPSGFATSVQTTNSARIPQPPRRVNTPGLQPVHAPDMLLAYANSGGMRPKLF
jgi:hypothetical protein